MTRSAAASPVGGPESAPRPADLDWDPFDESVKADPYPVWRRLRDEAPAYFNERLDFWALSRFDDVERAHRDPKTYSSAHGTVLEIMTEEAMHEGLMIFLDPPEHTRLRKLVSRAFTPRRVTALESEIRSLCVQLLEDQRGRERFDYVQDFGARVPATVIAALLGVPAGDREDVRETIDTVFHLDPDTGMINETSINAMAKLHSYIAGQLADRARRPRDDMLSDLLEAEVEMEDGSSRRLTQTEATDFGILLISAGTETVAKLLGWAGLVLADHEGQRRELVEDPSLIPAAVEELLRYEAPSPVQGRWLTTDVELHGQVMPANARILLLTGSAGRDERRFVDPDVFDIHRQANQHVSFGYGIHFCLGAALARLEGRIALEETLKRFPSWSVDRENAVLMHTSTVRGYSRLPILV